MKIIGISPCNIIYLFFITIGIIKNSIQKMLHILKLKLN